MKKTAAMFGILLLFLSSLSLAEGDRRRKKSGLIKRLDLVDENFEGIVPNNNVKRMIQQQRDQKFRRSICLSARELDCEKELRDQCRYSGCASSSKRIKMKKTAAMFGILLLFLSSLSLAEGYRRRKKYAGLIKRLDLVDENFEGFVPNNNVKRMIQQQRDQEFRRSICLSARELDCEKELRDQCRYSGCGK
ncbi:hypothetical protein OS493_035983 [Desmophyllum pertusum]|uniref:Uncharacterized protein n=1 Tax=Desmophyllum pertusum TaxID=174260 RepID=A0A9X0CDS5_9CNID|nr:hypothetical protein OS493_035983 [Desmophyllum pertusum]